MTLETGKTLAEGEAEVTAAADIFEKEPPESNNPLLKNNKVFLSPHSATFTEECTERMEIDTIQNIIYFFVGKLDKAMIVKL